MKNRDNYKRVFDEVHAPAALLGKVMDMKKEKKEIKCKSRLRYAFGAAAAFALCMVISNGICYAATGETWVSKVHMYINGEETEQEVVWHEDEDGIYGTFEVDADDENAVVEVIEIPDAGGIDAEDMEDSEMVLYNCGLRPEIVREGDRLILCIGDSEIDITEDFADGECSGTFELQGVSFHYQVTGNADEYEISVN